VNTSSIFGPSGAVGYAAYAASKAGMLGLTRTAALELAADGIRVNSICPGDTDTPMIRSIADTPSGALPPVDDLPFKRWAQPEEVSAAVVFLASNESSYMSGSELVVDGAFTAQ
jgi:3alpha(or 20beta)-hydroxysteroid dehydrogenase